VTGHGGEPVDAAEADPVVRDRAASAYALEAVELVDVDEAVAADHLALVAAEPGGVRAEAAEPDLRGRRRALAGAQVHDDDRAVPSWTPSTADRSDWIVPRCARATAVVV
jgi:hypothetical protein